MNKTEILNIVNEPSKHIQIVKIDGKDSIIYSSKFVELLELIPTMLTKADMVAMLTEIQLEIEELNHKGSNCYRDGYTPYSEGLDDCKDIIQQKINALKGDSDGA